MLIKLHDPDGNILIVNTDHIAAIAPVFDKPNPNSQNNHGIPQIGHFAKPA
jgi:hypothetical protein